MLGGGAIAGIGFTVSLLIASLAFNGVELEEAKLGVLTAALGASLLTSLVFRRDRDAARARSGSARWSAPREAIVDLAVPVDPERDHIRGPVDAPVTLVEYGDFECPYCGQAEPIIRELLAGFGDLRYVWRHLPLNDVHPQAQLAAEASEAAADQDSFWEMYDVLLAHQDALAVRDLVGYARGARARRRAVPRAPPQAQGAPAGSPRTSSRPTSAASPARRRSSSTAAATTAPTTSTTLSAEVKAARARALVMG